MRKVIFIQLTVVMILLLIAEVTSAQTFAWRKITSLPTLSSTYDSYDDVFFINSNTGWVNHHSGKFYKTTNSGVSWNLVFNDTSFYFAKRISFANELIGWSGLTNGLAKTTNSGNTWVKINIPNMSGISFPGISVINQNTVYVCSNSNGAPKFAKTTDGGATWSVSDLSTYVLGISDCYFFNESTGFASGYNSGNYLVNSKGVVLYTSNGGTTWANRYTTNATGVNASEIYFNHNNSVGGVVLEGSVSPSVFLKTIDQGTTFSELVFSNTSYLSQALCFKDANVGWIGGSRLTTAPIFYTNNGGTSFDTTRWGKNITSFIFVNDTIGFASGYCIYKYSNAFDVGIHNEGETVTNYSLSQNYPNPFNPTTMIKFSLLKTGLVTLTIYDVTGRQIQTLINEVRPSGNYTIDFTGSSLSSGVYFYKIQSGDFVSAKRMLLIK
ncbi:MAG: T9SS type A sorting domain-containing protein [Ignavibacteriae bacterium]|nr:T9SS type A sorting domain-containing protein [Ignavibacteriota bacterium]